MTDRTANRRGLIGPVQGVAIAQVQPEGAENAFVFALNVLDVTAVAVLKKETHLPVIIDPSHAGGKAWMVPALSCAAVAAGADALLIEVHPCPAEAWCDADQALSIEEFGSLMTKLRAIAHAVGRTIPTAKQRPREEVAVA